MIKSYAIAALAALALTAPVAAQQTTTPQQDAVAPTGDMSSDDPSVTVVLVPIHDQLAAQFPLTADQMVSELVLPVEVAAGACGAAVDTLQGAEASCEATTLTPDLVAYFEDAPDAESDGVPDTLKLPPTEGVGATAPQ